MNKIAVFSPEQAQTVLDAAQRILNFRVTGARLFSNRRGGISLDVTPPARGSRAATRFRVKSESNDYLTCRTWDGTTEGSFDVLIAKPRELRHDYALYTGLTALTTTDATTVSATDGSTTETWIVTPLYKAEADIWATVPAGGTGVTVDGEELTWLDDNRSSRAWAVDA